MEKQKNIFRKTYESLPVIEKQNIRKNIEMTKNKSAWTNFLVKTSYTPISKLQLKTIIMLGKAMSQHIEKKACKGDERFLIPFFDYIKKEKPKYGFKQKKTASVYETPAEY